MAELSPDPQVSVRLGRPFQGEDIPWSARLRVLSLWLGLAAFVASPSQKIGRAHV